MTRKPQDSNPDLEDWLLETWPLVDQEQGPLQTLVKCVAAVDYAIRNAGDIEAAEDIRPEFQSAGWEAADLLQLPISRHAFLLTKEHLSDQWYDIFDGVILEIRTAWERTNP